MEFVKSHNSKSTALELAQCADGSEEVGTKEILKNVVLKHTFWLLFRASGKRNSGLGAESPNAILSSAAVIIERAQKEKRFKNYLQGLGDEIPNAPLSSKTEIVDRN